MPVQLRIGMPSGSLADPNRGGNLIDLLNRAGFPTKGYDAGGPTKFPSADFLFGWDGRPQEFGSQLGLDELDVAIGGDDWMRERVVELATEYGKTIAPEKVLSLKRGGVRIVGIVNESDKATDTVAWLKAHAAKGQGLITVVAEMPYLALDWLRDRLQKAGLADRYARHSVQKYRTPPKIDAGIVIYETWGKTEAKVKNGGADIGLEITQSGSALKNYGLRILDEVMTSETGIWINPALRRDAEKLRLLRLLLLNLAGAINAEGKVLLLFNVANDQAAAVEEYLSRHRLFADEPTSNRGRGFTEYSVQVTAADAKLPLARVRFELAELGAQSIDTVPLSSSIPSLASLGI